MAPRTPAVFYRLALRRARALLLLGTAALLVSPGPAEAKRRFVPRQHKTVQAAIDAASPGDTVWVAAGVYRGPIRLTKRLVLFGEGGAEKTILDGRDSVRVLEVEGVNQGGIVGFGIRGGKANAGGGIRCVGDTSFAIRDCIFTGNWESAVSIWKSNGVTVGGCRFRENRGSAIRADHSMVAVFESQFEDNEGNEGGAIALFGSRLVLPLRNLTFERNRATSGTGGAVHAADSSQGTSANCAFRENRASVAGGAVAIMSGSVVNVSRSIFERNTAQTGGALQCDRSRMNVGYSLFDRNSAAGMAAAIGVVGRGAANVNPILGNNTFHKNEVRGDGACFFFVDVSPEVRKNIMVLDRGQRAVTGLQTSPLYDCNLIWDPSGGAIGALPSVNTWVGDPLFCDADHGNFKVRDLSPALRAPCGPIGAFTEKAGCTSFRLQPAN